MRYDQVNMPCRLLMHPSHHLVLRTGNLVVVNVKIKHEQFRFFGAVSAADGAHEFTIAAADAPHNAAAASALQCYEVPQEFTGSQVPYLDGAVVRRRDNKAPIELEASDSTLMFVGTCTLTSSSHLCQSSSQFQQLFSRFFTGRRMPFLSLNQRCQCNEGNSKR